MKTLKQIVPLWMGIVMGILIAMAVVSEQAGYIRGKATCKEDPVIVHDTIVVRDTIYRPIIWEGANNGERSKSIDRKWKEVSIIDDSTSVIIVGDGNKVTTSR